MLSQLNWLNIQENIMTFSYKVNREVSDYFSDLLKLQKQVHDYNDLNFNFNYCKRL